MIRFKINEDGTGKITVAGKSGSYRWLREQRQDVEFFRNMWSAGLNDGSSCWNVEMNVEDVREGHHFVLKNEGNPLKLTFKATLNLQKLCKK